MKEHISAYIKDLNALYQTGLTTEHSFRPPYSDSIVYLIFRWRLRL